MSSSTSPVLSEKQVERILEATNDDHGGVIVEMTNEPLDPGVFASLLRASLSRWRKEFWIFEESCKISRVRVSDLMRSTCVSR